MINADDFYGKQAYEQAYAYLTGKNERPGTEICMVGFILKNTLSENGSVTRGLCTLGTEHMLEKVVETRNIEKLGDSALIRSEEGDVTVDANCLVSMNMWGLQPGFFQILESGFVEFLSKVEAEDTKAEYLLPTIIGGLLEDNKVSVKVLDSTDKWFGVTYIEDRESVVESIRELIKTGKYPERLPGVQ